MDHFVLFHLNALLVDHDGIEDPVRAYVQASEALFAVGLLLVVVVGAIRGRINLIAAGLSAGVSTVLALLIGKGISSLVDRPRPFVSHPRGVHLFVHHASDPGFPSDHATAAFAIATALWLRERRIGTLALIGAAILSAGRVALGVHWPSDVIAGAALGTACALLCARFARPLVESVAGFLARSRTTKPFGQFSH
jgi:undecaprenyl-diphosphatase